MVKTSRARKQRHGRYERLRRSFKKLAWLDRESTRLGATATPDTFVALAAQATGILTLTGNVTGSVAATEILTLTGQPLDTETVTIGIQVYTFQTVLVDAADNVLIGATASDSIDNLIAAITGGAGAGTLYGTATVTNADVTAAVGAGDTMDITALARGIAANSLDTLEGLTNGSWGAATMSGGIDGDIVTIGTQSYTFNAATLVDTADNILVGAAATDSLDNLIAAVNSAAGEGATYGTGTVANVDVTVAAGAGDTMDALAIALGALGNVIATTDVSANASWGNATLQGGVTSNGFTAAAHGMTSGEGPYQVTTTVTLPAGLALLIDYWVNVIDANTFSLRQGAANGTEATITDTGSGVHTITKQVDDSAIFDSLNRNKPRTIEATSDIDDLN